MNILNQKRTKAFIFLASGIFSFLATKNFFQRKEKLKRKKEKENLIKKIIKTLEELDLSYKPLFSNFTRVSLNFRNSFKVNVTGDALIANLMREYEMIQVFMQKESVILAKYNFTSNEFKKLINNYSSEIDLEILLNRIKKKIKRSGLGLPVEEVLSIKEINPKSYIDQYYKISHILLKFCDELIHNYDEKCAKDNVVEDRKELEILSQKYYQKKLELFENIFKTENLPYAKQEIIEWINYMCAKNFGNALIIGKLIIHFSSPIFDNIFAKKNCKLRFNQSFESYKKQINDKIENSKSEWRKVVNLEKKQKLKI